MKTIIYLICSSLVFITLTASCQKTAENKKNVILQTSDVNVSSQLLTQSAKIISDRLKIFGLDSFNVIILDDKRQIKVQLPEKSEISEFEGLFTSKGELALYEVLTFKDIADSLKKDPISDPVDARIGCATFENHATVDSVEAYLKSINLYTNCKLLWGVKTDKSPACLYAVKTNNTGNPLLVRSDVESINSSIDNSSKSYMIEIKFKPSSIKTWENATKNNIDKPIAIVIDDRVFGTPVVRGIIEIGECVISGDYSQKDVDYFLALVNNEQLPLNFNLVK